MTFNWLWSNWGNHSAASKGFCDGNRDYSYTSAQASSAIALTAGNDIYNNNPQIVEKVDGLAGIDTANIGYSAACMSITAAANGFWKICVNGNQIMQVRNIERLCFNDAVFVLDVSGKWVKDGAIGGGNGGGAPGPTVINLTPGNDVYLDKAGVEYVDGGAGNDTIVFNGNAGTVNFAQGANGFIVMTINGQPVIQFKNIERIEFSDKAFVLNTNGQWIIDTSMNFISLTAGDDLYANAAGVDKVDGLAGNDVIAFTESLKAVSNIVTDANGITHVFINGQEAIQFRNIEALKFADGLLIKNATGQWVQDANYGFISLTAGNDTYANAAGIEKVDGLAGTDTITFTEKLSAISRIVVDANGITHVFINGQEAIQFRNVEKLQFADGLLVKNTTGQWVLNVANEFTSLSSGDDTYVDVAGVEKIDGLAGTDTVKFNSAIASLTSIATDANGVTRVYINGQEAIQFKNIEKLEFTNGILVKTATGQWTLDTLLLTSGDDTYTDVAGVEKVDGLAGTDTVNFNRAATNVTFSTDASGFIKVSINGAAAILVKNVEKLVFTDKTYIKDASGNFVLQGASGDGFTELTTGDDTYANIAGVEKIDGLAGTDTITFTESVADVTDISTDANGVTTVKIGGAEVIMFKNVERLQFADVVLIKDANGDWVEEGTGSPFTDGNDTYANQPGVENIDMLGGTDTITFTENVSDVTDISTDAEGVTTVKIGDVEVIKFKNVERLQFADTVLVKDANGDWVEEGGTGSPFTDGDDTYANQPGVENIDMLGGIDTITFTENVSAVTNIITRSDGLVSVEINGVEAITFKNAERLVFADGVYAKNGAGVWVIETPVDSFTQLTTGDDTYANAAGVEKIDGLAGTDTVSFTETVNQVTNITTDANGVTTVFIAGQAAIQFKNIEKLAFADATLVKNASGIWSVQTTTVDYISLTAGNDTYADQLGNEKVDGLAGTDTVIINAASSALTGASVTADGFLALTIAGQDGIQVRNVERIVFTDKVFTKDASGNWVVETAPNNGIINLTAGNDIYQNVAGVEKVDGLAGTDTVVINGPLSSLTSASATADGFLSLVINGQEEIQIRNIERVQFSDTVLVKDGSGNWVPEGSTPTPTPTPTPVDYIQLTSGNDIYINAPGNEKVDGGAGQDTVIIQNSVASLNGITTTSDGFLQIHMGNEDVIQVRNIERIVFNDASFVKDASGSWITETYNLGADGSVNLGAGDNVYINQAGVEKVDGGAGKDTVVFDTSLRNVTGSTFTADGYNSISIDGQEAIQIKNVEYIVLNDAWLKWDGSSSWHVMFDHTV